MIYICLIAGKKKKKKYTHQTLHDLKLYKIGKYKPFKN
jgi:hypothetical protein